MPKVATAKLLALLRQRGGPLDCAGFVDSYTEFVRDCLAGRETYNSGPYYDWIVAKIQIHGYYGKIRTAADIAKRLARDRKLITDIAANGIHKPVQLMPDTNGLEIDGWHRAVIADVLGFADMSCEVAAGFKWPPELDMKDLTLLIAHPDDEILFLWPFLPRTAHIICVVTDENNPQRLWCAKRKEALQIVASIIDASVEFMGANSEFYRLPTRDETLKSLAVQVVERLQDYPIVATHNPWGEYGHLDHILCHQIARASGLPILTTDIAESVNWLPIRAWNEFSDPLLENMVDPENHMDREFFNECKSIYTRLGCWTWSRPPVETCGVFEC